jgi:hypothetical protein
MIELPTRRDFVSVAAATAAGGFAGPLILPAAAATGAMAGQAAANQTEASAAEIYRHLGFATMSGEDPLKLWTRLRNTREWLVGPLAPDAWAGQVFIADHEDIFAFRFLPLPKAWMTSAGARRAAYCAANFEKWLGVGRWLGAWRNWWKSVGPKSPDDSYARLVWQMPEGGPEVTYEWARTAPNEVVCRVRNSTPSDVAVQAYVPWTGEGPRYAALYSQDPERRFLRGRSWVPGTRDGMRWVLACSAASAEAVGEGSTRFCGFYPEVESLYFCGRQGQSYAELERATGDWLAPGRIDELLERNRLHYLAARPNGTGFLADAPAAINDQLQWSEVYTASRRRTYITVSRGWGFFPNNSAPDFLWDSFFNAVLVSQEDEAKAHNMVRDMVAWQTDPGMFPQFGEFSNMPQPTTPPVARGHTQYPIAALTVAKVHMRHPNRAFLSEIYPHLLRSHRWWFADRGDGQPWRDGNRNGLLELGSNYPEEISVRDRRQMACNESYDDSPQWATVAYNEKTGTLEQDTVERNCLYAMDCWVLTWLARELGRETEAAELEAEHRRMAGTINRLLWDAKRQCYYNRRWEPLDGDWFYPQVSPDIFFSLLGKVAAPDQEQALRKLFHDPTKFAGEWILPSISRDDPQYPRQDYWRGKAWAPINWLAYQGFKIYNWDREARLLAESSAKMFLKAWREKGECHENFLSTTGVGSGDPHYTWGALMALVAIEELIDANPWHGLRFGSPEVSQAGGVERYPVAGALYDVSLAPDGLSVARNGQALFKTDAPVEIRRVAFSGNRVDFEIRASQRVGLIVGGGRTEYFQPGVTPGSGRL